MKDIFSDIYDRVLSFFTSQNQDETKAVAKSRLRTVLMQDRVGFSESAMQMLKDDMLHAISKYLEIDDDSFDLSIDATENATILNLSIPVLRPKTDEEIAQAQSQQEQEKIEKTQVIVGELKELVKEKAQELAEQINDEEKSNKKTKKNDDENSQNEKQTESEDKTQQDSSKDS